MPGRQHKHLRLFVAIDPPKEVCASLLSELERTCDVSNARLTPLDQIHMTLQFIGDSDARQLESVMESVERSTSGIGRFELTVRALIQLPERGRPRLIAAETDAPGNLLELQRRLAHRLAHHARKNAADRFRPHLTLCRYRRDGRAERFGEPGRVEALSFQVERVRLISSVLRSDGATHREVGAFALD